MRVVDGEGAVRHDVMHDRRQFLLVLLPKQVIDISVVPWTEEAETVAVSTPVRTAMQNQADQRQDHNG